MGVNINTSTTVSRRGTSIIRVTVTFSEANNVQGATVTVNGQSKDTDVNGKASFWLDVNKTYDYTVTKGGYESHSSSVIVQESNLTESITLQVSPLEFVTTETGTFTGTITMTTGGATVNYNA